MDVDSEAEKEFEREMARYEDDDEEDDDEYKGSKTNHVQLNRILDDHLAVMKNPRVAKLKNTDEEDEKR